MKECDIETLSFTPWTGTDSLKHHVSLTVPFSQIEEETVGVISSKVHILQRTMDENLDVIVPQAMGHLGEVLKLSLKKQNSPTDCREDRANVDGFLVEPQKSSG